MDAGAADTRTARQAGADRMKESDRQKLERLEFLRDSKAHKQVRDMGTKQTNVRPVTKWYEAKSN